jgi:hypothetical protein
MKSLYFIGIAVVTVKALEHRRKKYKQQDVFKQYRLGSNTDHTKTLIDQSSAIDSQFSVEEDLGMSVSSANTGEAQIFFHLFKEGEFEDLLRGIGIAGVSILHSRFLSDHNSWYYMLRKA